MNYGQYTQDGLRFAAILHHWANVFLRAERSQFLALFEAYPDEQRPERGHPVWHPHQRRWYMREGDAFVAPLRAVIAHNSANALVYLGPYTYENGEPGTRVLVAELRGTPYAVVEANSQIK